MSAFGFIIWVCLAVIGPFIGGPLGRRSADGKLWAICTFWGWVVAVIVMTAIMAYQVLHPC